MPTLNSTQTPEVRDDLEMISQAVESCACFNLRKATRAVTQIYDDSLRPLGLRSGQLTLLMAARLKGASTIHDLADMVWVDRTALSRNLKPLIKKGLLQVEPGPDRRTRFVSVTAKGEEAISDAMPAWEKAQEQTKTTIGEVEIMQLMNQLSTVQKNLKPQPN